MLNVPLFKLSTIFGCGVKTISCFAKSFFKSFHIKLNVPHQAVFDVISSSKDVTMLSFVLTFAMGAYFLPQVLNITGLLFFILFKSIKNITPIIIATIIKIASMIFVDFFI